MLSDVKYLLLCITFFMLTGCTLSAPESQVPDKITYQATRLEHDQAEYHFELPAWDIRLPKRVSIGNNKVYLKHVVIDEYEGTLGDLLKTVALITKISIVYDSADVSKQNISLVGFQGAIGDLFSLLSELADVFFVERNGVIYVRKTAPYFFYVYGIPVSQVFSALQSSGGNSGASGTVSLAESMQYDEVNQSIYGQIRPNQLYLLQNVLKDIVNNGLSRIDYKFYIMEIEKRSLQGFNFEHFGLDVGPSLQVTGQTSIKPGDSLTSFSLSTSKFTSMIQLLKDSQKLVNFYAPHISINSGEEAKLTIGSETPYVEEITRSTNTATQNEGSNTATEDVSVAFGEALSGIELSLKSRYLNKMKLVNIELSLKVNDVASMMEVKAGDNAYTRPVTTKREYTTKITLDVGAIYVFGGFAWNRQDHATALLPSKFYDKYDNIELYFAIRPVIVLWKPKNVIWHNVWDTINGVYWK